MLELREYLEEQEESCKEGFGARLRCLVKFLGNEVSLADHAGCSQRTINNYITKAPPNSLESVVNLATNFGLSAHWLLLGEGPIFSADFHRDSYAERLDTELLKVAWDAVMTFETGVPVPLTEDKRAELLSETYTFLQEEGRTDRGALAAVRYLNGRYLKHLRD